MLADVAKAQAATLREWADIWENDPQIPEGKSGVAFLLRRSAAAMTAIATGAPMPEFEQQPKPNRIDEPREG